MSNLAERAEWVSRGVAYRRFQRAKQLATTRANTERNVKQNAQPTPKHRPKRPGEGGRARYTFSVGFFSGFCVSLSVEAAFYFISLYLSIQFTHPEVIPDKLEWKELGEREIHPGTGQCGGLVHGKTEFPDVSGQ
uniref:Uncharacterized protein n=1 Tax=Anopheles atroparvus TaxID=41427 RepID=A0A182J6F5_ANOAO